MGPIDSARATRMLRQTGEQQCQVTVTAGKLDGKTAKRSHPIFVGSDRGHSFVMVAPGRFSPPQCNFPQPWRAVPVHERPSEGIPKSQLAEDSQCQVLVLK